jgi:hypothetical protein
MAIIPPTGSPYHSVDATGRALPMTDDEEPVGRLVCGTGPV